MEGLGGCLKPCQGNKVFGCVEEEKKGKREMKGSSQKGDEKRWRRQSVIVRQLTSWEIRKLRCVNEGIAREWWPVESTKARPGIGRGVRIAKAPEYKREEKGGGTKEGGSFSPDSPLGGGSPKRERRPG